MAEVLKKTWIQESNLLLELGWLRKELSVETFPIRQIQESFGVVVERAV